LCDRLTEDVFSSDLACLSGYSDYLKEHPQLISSFLKSMIRAAVFIKQDPAESQQVAGDALAIKPELLREIWPSLDLRVSLDQGLLVSLESQARWAQANQIITGTTIPNYLDYIYYDGLDSVMPESITIVR